MQGQLIASATRKEFEVMGEKVPFSTMQLFVLENGDVSLRMLAENADGTVIIPGAMIDALLAHRQNTATKNSNYAA